eukprot:gnl/MRDRNA2_/MRDRNA2_246721_c0_seq1.p1 gnl/MRDRNA2_/MRDRNA2_246721_c0~~gnl/MRDRNA2_/MRDRNA2_246721_c0_seq1.p1  ORF type:complete len:282 (-),score=26.87 gnl/MRDRNA2_/MRDRNA2_246721_c0_seq1:41-886(-)
MTASNFSPMTDEEYAEAFSCIMTQSNIHDQFLLAMKPIMDATLDPISLMSIGAGTAARENEMIYRCGMKVSRFHAIEPNVGHLQVLQDTTSQWEGIQVSIDGNYFDDAYSMAAEEKFDLILMVHAIYYIPNPAGVIERARSFLKPNGQLLVFVGTEKGSGISSSEKLSHIAGRKNPHFVCLPDICSAMDQNDIPYTVKEYPRQLDVTDFLRDPETFHGAISFALHVDYRKMDAALKEEIHLGVKSKAVEKEGKFFQITKHAMIKVEPRPVSVHRTGLRSTL